MVTAACRNYARISRQGEGRGLVLRGGRVAGGYGRTYTLLYRQWIYGAPHVDIVMAVTLSGGLVGQGPDAC